MYTILIVSLSIALQTSVGVGHTPCHTVHTWAQKVPHSLMGNVDTDIHTSCSSVCVCVCARVCVCSDKRTM